VIRFREFIVAEYDGADVTENTILGLDRLPRADRITLVQDLWDSIAGEGLAQISDARKRELGCTIAQLQNSRCGLARKGIKCIRSKYNLKALAK